MPLLNWSFTFFPLKLTHYSKDPIEHFARFPKTEDNEHSPSGLWLSDDSDYGWRAFLTDRLDSGSPEWADAPETWKFRTDFMLKPETLSSVLILETKQDLKDFTKAYGESEPRSCHVEGQPGFGIHINWHIVKRDCKGILITPYQPDLSHRSEVDPLHWYRFDCASGCLWDTSCLFAAQPQIPGLFRRGRVF